MMTKEKTFQEIKRSLLEKRLLRTFDLKKDIIIEIDISDYIIAEVLFQKKRSVEFISHKMNKAEQNYIITKKKILTVIQMMKK